MGLSDFAAQIQGSKIIPKDPFSHNAHLIDTDEPIIREYNKIVEKHELLSNVGDDITLRLYQNDNFLMAWLLSMSKRDQAFTPVFNMFYGAWRGELGLTRAKNGKERDQQAAGLPMPQQQQTGFGGELRRMIEEQQAQDANALNKFMPKR